MEKTWKRYGKDMEKLWKDMERQGKGEQERMLANQQNKQTYGPNDRAEWGELELETDRQNPLSFRVDMGRLKEK